jgi:hypothetical protein
MTDDMISEHLARAHLAESVTMDAETWTEVLQELQRYRQVATQAKQAGPVAWSDPSEPDSRYAFSWSGTGRHHSHIQPLYTAPPPRRPLTDQEADDLVQRFARYELLRAVEAAHGVE